MHCTAHTLTDRNSTVIFEMVCLNGSNPDTHKKQKRQTEKESATHKTMNIQSEICTITGFACGSDVLFCKHCLVPPCPKATIIEGITWAADVRCRDCNALVKVCYICDKAVLNRGDKHHVSNSTLLSYHAKRECHKRAHREWLRSQHDAFEETNGLAFMEDSEGDVTEGAPGMQQNTPTSFIAQYAEPKSIVHLFPTKTSSEYFSFNHHRELGGPKALFGRVLVNNSKASDSRLPIEEILYAGLFARIAMEVPGDTMKCISSLLQYREEQRMGLHATVTELLTPKDIPRILGNGKRSITTNLPMPPIEKLEEHIYVSPVEITRYLLAFGFSVESLHPGKQTVHSQTERGRELIDFASRNSSKDSLDCLVLPVYPWEDDMDVNDSKTNRNKIWVSVITIATPEKMIHRSTNTFVVAMGPSDADHSEVEKRYVADMKILAARNEFYHGQYKKVLPTVCLIYAAMADRPAKAKATHTLGGNSTHHQRFTWRVDLEDSLERLPSCPQCHFRRLNEYPDKPDCINCADWDFEGLVYSPPHEKYPFNEGKKYLKAKPVTFQSLRRATRRAEKNIMLGKWVKKETLEHFCRTNAIPSDVSDRLFFHSNQRAYAESANTEAVKVRSTFECPPIWSLPNTDLKDFVSAVMHQVFLGVVKSVYVDHVRKWLIAKKKMTAFTKYVNRRFKNLSNLKLEWLKVQELSSKGDFGRYVSENFVAFTKVCKWLHCHVSNIAPDEDPYEDPDKPVRHYTTREARNWLRSRRIAIPPKVSVKLLRDMIHQAIEANGGEMPPSHTEEEVHAPSEVIEDILIFMVAMISRIMVQGRVSEIHAKDVERHIKLFLTVLTAAEKKYGSDSDITKRSWYSKCNFITLLNIPRDLLRYGSLRLLWEGDGKGEGCLRRIKPHVHSLKEGWAYHATRRFYEGDALNRVMHPVLQQMGDPVNKTTGALRDMVSIGLERFTNMVEEPCSQQNRIERRQYVIYKNEDHARTNFYSGKPFSCVGFSDRSMAMLVEGSTQQALKLVPVGNDPWQTVCQASYFEWTIAQNVTSIREDQVIRHHVVFLPFEESGPNKNKFYIVNSHWMEWNHHQSFGTPQIRVHLHETETDCTLTDQFTELQRGNFDACEAVVA